MEYGGCASAQSEGSAAATRAYARMIIRNLGTRTDPHGCLESWQRYGGLRIEGLLQVHVSVEMLRTGRLRFAVRERLLHGMIVISWSTLL